MNDYKLTIKDFYPAIAITLFVVLSYYVYVVLCDATPTEPTNAAVQHIKNDISDTGSSVVESKRKVESAEKSIERIGGEIAESQQRAKEMSRGLDECINLVDRCLELNREAQKGLDAIGGSSGEGTQGSKTN